MYFHFSLEAYFELKDRNYIITKKSSF